MGSPGTHKVRTDALASCTGSRHRLTRALGFVAGQTTFAIQTGRGRKASKRSANAVWVYAHPGFKSPSLRQSDQRFSPVHPDRGAAGHLLQSPWHGVAGHLPPSRRSPAAGGAQPTACGPATVPSACGKPPTGP